VYEKGLRKGTKLLLTPFYFGMMELLKRFFNRITMVNLQSRLVIGFLIATCLTGLVATVVGIRIINENTIAEVQRKVQQDINTARLVFDYNMAGLKSQIQCLALRTPLRETVQSRNIEALENLRGLIRDDTISYEDCVGLDMLAVVDTEGTVLYRASNPGVRGDNIMWDVVVRKCLDEGVPHSSVELMPAEVIERENPGLSSRVKIPIVKTPQSITISEKQLSEGLVMRAAYPIIDDELNLLGALVGGTLINKDYTIVDKIKETVYHDEKYRNLDMGFATIFQGGIRVSTNVMTENNQRAIGTIVSKEVYERVIGKGEEWIGRAFVVNDWYISSYAPIYDINDTIIGMLYTGILEAKYRDMKQFTVLIFLGITTLGMIMAFGISFFFGHTIIKRIRILKKATEKIASGDLNYQLPRDRSSGFDILDDAFNNMAKSLKDRDDRLQRVFKQLTRTERLAALGQIAAGVAHEINNPLGGILLYSNLVAEELPEENTARGNIEKIIYQANRCKEIVRNLLDFARTPAGDMMPFNINNIILTALNLVKDQSMFLGISIEADLAEDIPDVKGDRSRLEQVFLNLFINAADAMGGKGKMTIATEELSRQPGDSEDVVFHDEKICLLTSPKTVKVIISDTGKGIDRAYLPHIFEPFFTTKDPGQGTGLGLSIAYGIIQRHSGFIDVESEPGKGTTFIISLPAYIVEGIPIDGERKETMGIG
jgi:two-component system NtrC family sensor kinase